MTLSPKPGVRSPAADGGVEGAPSGQRLSWTALDPGLSRFAGVLLVYVCALAGLATLSPFDFDWRDPHGWFWFWSPADVALNLVLLFPAGFLLRLARAGRGDRFALDALALGLAFSAGLELMQTFSASRVSSPIDVVTNGLGAWAGGFVHARLGPWLDRRLHQQLGLHLPLANILYLVLPLCSLDALCIRDARELAAVSPLCAFTAFIAGGLYKHRLREAIGSLPGRYALVIGTLFGLGYLPFAARAPLFGAGLALASALLTRLAIAARSALAKQERRFVLLTIRRSLTWFGLFVLALACRSWLQQPLLAAEFARLPPIAGGEARALVLLRDVSAASLFGYLISELQARSPLPAARILSRVLWIAGALALAQAALRAQLDRAPLDVFAFSACTVAGLAGGMIHRAQLRLVRSWGHSLPPPSMLPSASG